MWEYCGMGRTAQSLDHALARIPEIRAEFWENLNVPNSGTELNQSLERAGRVADFLELGELMCRDARLREESCGGHFREEYQTADGEALRDDKNFCHAAVWEYQGDQQAPARHTEPLTFEYVHLATRNYK
jgi:succinate dehydrogenase / fumarate reductase flavoprotein subunit